MVVRGRVQGVAFRAATLDEARRIGGLAGWVKNLPDRSVEVLAEGARADVEALLAWCRRFRLRAECVVEGRRLTLALGTGDPIFPADEPRRYDSQLEERFARDFRRVAPDWDVLREPEPVPVGPPAAET